MYPRENLLYHFGDIMPINLIEDYALTDMAEIMAVGRNLSIINAALFDYRNSIHNYNNGYGSYEKHNQYYDYLSFIIEAIKNNKPIPKGIYKIIGDDWGPPDNFPSEGEAEKFIDNNRREIGSYIIEFISMR